MKSCGFTKEEAREWSMQSDRYTESGFDSAWNSYDEHTNTATEGTIRYYAKLSNTTEYKNMPAKENEFLPLDIACKGALNIAECVAPKLEQNFKWSNETWYMFYNKTKLRMKQNNLLILLYKLSTNILITASN